jgi:hypothetical protein
VTFADTGTRPPHIRKSILPKEAAVSKTHRLLISAAVIAASLAPAASAFALAGTNHNELLLLDD